MNVFNAKAVKSQLNKGFKDIDKGIKDIGKGIKDIGKGNHEEKKKEVQQRLEKARDEYRQQEEATTPSEHNNSPQTATQEINFSAIEQQLAMEARAREKEAKDEQLSKEKEKEKERERERKPEPSTVAVPLVKQVNASSLSDEDIPKHELFNSMGLNLLANEGFLFAIDVNPGYFQVLASNLHGTALESLAKLGTEPTIYMKLRVIDPRPWAQPWEQEINLGSHLNRHFDKTFSVTHPGTIQIIIEHNSNVIPGGTKSCNMALCIKSCFTTELVLFHPTNGVRPSCEIQGCLDQRESIKPTQLLPTPGETAEDVRNRHSYTATGVGDDIYIFGGCRADGTITNHFFLLDMKDEKLGVFGDLFSKPVSHGSNRFVYTGVCPAPRAGHSAVVYAGMICIFGGFSVDELPLPETHFFHMDERAWSCPDAFRGTSIITDPTVASLPRGFHSAVVHDDNMYIYGGCTNFASGTAQRAGNWTTSALWRYAFKERSWQDLTEVCKNLPHERGRIYGHSATVSNGNMYVFGGMAAEKRSGRSTGSRNNDLYQVNLQTLVWTQIRTSGVPPRPQCFAFMGTLDSQFKNNKTHWPYPRISMGPRTLMSALGPGQLHCIYVYGGQSTGGTTDTLCVLPLAEFRGHAKMEWFGVNIDETEVLKQLGRTPRHIAATNSSGGAISDAMGTMIKIPKAALFSIPKAALYDLPRSALEAITSSEKADKSRHAQSALDAFVSIPKAALYDIPKAALYDLPKAALLDLPKAAVEAVMDEEKDLQPEPPGTHAVILIDGVLTLVTFGIRNGGPYRSDKEPRCPAPIVVVPCIQPADFDGSFTNKPHDLTAEDELEENTVAKAFSEFEQHVATLKAHIQVVNRLAAATPKSDYAVQYGQAFGELRKLIKRCNIVQMGFHTSAFGAKGNDLIELFEVLQHQVQSLPEPELPPPAIINNISENVTPRNDHDEPISEHHSGVDLTPPPLTLTKEGSGLMSKMGKIMTFKKGGQSPNSTRRSSNTTLPAVDSDHAPKIISSHQNISTSFNVHSTRRSSIQESTPPPAAPPPPPPAVYQPPPQRPEINVTIDTTNCPKEVQNLSRQISLLETQIDCVRCYRKSVAAGDEELRSALEEETTLLDQQLKAGDTLCHDLTSRTYSKAISEKVEALIRKFFALQSEGIVLVSQPVPVASTNPVVHQPTPLPGHWRHNSNVSPKSLSPSPSMSNPETPTSFSDDAGHISDSRSSISSTELPRKTFNKSDLGIISTNPRDQEFQRNFNLPPTERPLDNFACTYHYQQGRLYVSRDHLCFSSSMSKDKLVISLRDITNIEKKKTASMFDTAMEVVLTDGKRHSFTSLVHRNRVVDLILQLRSASLISS